LVGDGLVRHDVVEDCADGGPGHLRGECYAGGKVAVLSELEILGEKLTLDEGVVSLCNVRITHRQECGDNLRRVRSTCWQRGCLAGYIRQSFERLAAQATGHHRWPW
jgi:hypothetical protein